MIGMGDEVRRTQGGNNNAYCQDNETSWFDWDLTKRARGHRRFVRGLIDVRLALDMTQVLHGLTLEQFLARSFVEFHGVRLHQPDWSADSHTSALTIRSVIGTPDGARDPQCLDEEPLDFELPPVASPGLPWRRIVDTGLDAPDDICGPASAPEVRSNSYRAAAHSVVLLSADLRERGEATAAPGAAATAVAAVR